MTQDNLNFAVLEDGSAYLEKCSLSPQTKLGDITCQDYSSAVGTISKNLDTTRETVTLIKSGDGSGPDMTTETQEFGAERGGYLAIPFDHPVHGLGIPVNGSDKTYATIHSTVFRSVSDGTMGIPTLGEYNPGASTPYYGSESQFDIEHLAIVSIKRRMCHYDFGEGNYRPFHVLRIVNNSECIGYTVTIITYRSTLWYNLTEGTLEAYEKRETNGQYAYTFVIMGGLAELKFDIGDSNYNLLFEVATLD